MARIQLHSPRAIVNEEGNLVWTDAGTILDVPSQGVTEEDAKLWVEQGAAVELASRAKAAKEK